MEKNVRINYLGIVGAIMLLIGEFMPCMEVWGFSVSLFDSLKEISTSVNFPFIAILIPCVIGICCWFNYSKFSCGAGIVALIALLLVTFADNDGFSIRQVMGCSPPAFGSWRLAAVS